MKTDEEIFLLGEDCQGVTWREGKGWYGCLRWSNGLGDTDHMGPFPGIIPTYIALRYAFAQWMNAFGESTP